MILKSKTNYKAWQIKPENFPANAQINEQIKFLLGFGVLAPSGHNSQPWKFQIVDNTLYIFVETSRSLQKSDPKGKQLRIGLGCLIENLLIAGDYYGFTAEVSLENDVTGKSPIAKISFKKEKESTSDLSHLINFITKRSTNRNNYSSRAVPEKFEQDIKNLDSEEIKIFITKEAGLNNKIVDLVSDAQISIMEKKEFRGELSELMKPNFTKSKVGMPGFAFGLPLPISMLSSFMIKNINMSKLNKKADEAIFKHTPSFLIIAAKQDAPEAWVNSGRLFEKVWLMAVKNGLAISPNAAPVADQPFSGQLQTLIGTNFTPQIFARMGFAEKAALHTPRLTTDDVIISSK